MLKPTTRGLAAVACAMTLTALGTACGSSDSTSSQDASSEGDSGVEQAIEEATATVAELSVDQEFTVEPLSGRVPEGKVVAQVNCTIPVCGPGEMEEPVE